MSDTPLHEVGEVIEAGAATWWVSKVARGHVDPNESKGRFLGSVYVTNGAQYTGAAVGQIALGHLVWPFIAKLLLIPWWILSFCLVVLLPMILLQQPDPNALTPGVVATSIPAGLYVLLGGFCFIIWGYLCVWRLSLKPLLKLVLKHGPSISYADGYQGPFGIGNAPTQPGHNLATRRTPPQH